MDDLDSQFDKAVANDDARDARRFYPARWPGGPVICKVVNLPAFPSKETAVGWLELPRKTNPQYEVSMILKIWQCESCQWWHFITKPRDPAGSSSGQGRSSKG